MKSERRHELQHNALLDWLLETRNSIQPHINAILLGAVLVLVASLAYLWVSRQSSGKEADAWDSVFVAMSTGDTAQLDQTIELYPGTTAAEWAAVVSGDLHLNAGCEDLFTTKATAADQLQKALASYQRVLDSSREPVIRERATYGLARTYEAMAATRQSQGELNLAIENYQKVATEWPDGAYANAAKERAEALGQQSTKEFFDALAAWEPRPAFTSPQGLDNLNIPFDENGEGLDVGGQPKSFFGDITGQEPTENAPPDDQATPTEEVDETEAPMMPEATGADDPPAQEKPASKPPASEVPQ